MSPSSRLCLLTVVALILPSRDEANMGVSLTPPIPTPTPTPEAGDEANMGVSLTPPIPTLTPEASDEANMGVSLTPPIPTPTPEASEATGSQTAAKLTERDTTNPVTDPGTPRARQEDSQEKANNPFYYDDATLRKRGLLVAAVLFITGILILTSGKCRQLSQMCLSRNRAYRVVDRRGFPKEEADGGSQA